MKPSDYLKHYMRNSINPDRFRPYIPGYTWPIEYWIMNKTKSKKKQTLCFKDYKQITNRKKYRRWRIASMRKTRKLLYRIAPNGINNFIENEINKRSSIVSTFTNDNWVFIPMPQKMKEYFSALEGCAPQPIISTDMPSAVNHFERIEDTYLQYLNKGNRMFLSTEKVREAIRLAISAPYNKDAFQLRHKIKFRNGIEILFSTIKQDDVKALTNPNIFTIDDTEQE